MMEARQASIRQKRLVRKNKQLEQDKLMRNMTTEEKSICMSNAKVELIDVALKGCDLHALFIPEPTSETTLVATRCEFANSDFGAVLAGRHKLSSS